MKKILKGGCAILAVVVMLITTASAETGMVQYEIYNGKQL